MILILIDDIVNKYNNAYHSTIKIKPVDGKSSTNIDSSKEINNKDPKFKIGSIVRISIYKSVFTKCCPPNCSEEDFPIKRLKILFRGHIWLMILIKKKLLGHSTKKNCKKKTNQKEFRTEKIIKKKGDKLYVKWKEHKKNLISG